MNLFKFLENNINNNESMMYGDFINPPSIENKLNRVLNENEVKEYKQYIENNKKRLNNECEITTNKIMKSTNEHQFNNISGIGIVQQIL